MVYASVADMNVRYGRDTLRQLAEQKIDCDNDGQPLQTVEQVIETALADASAAIDGYIDTRLLLPLQKVPAVLIRHTCILARYALEPGAATEKAEKEYDATIRFLEKVSTGDISLALTQDEEQPDTGDVVVMENAGSVWARDRSKGYI
ncbi:gp436 family protein [Limnobaculum xujianqingii]|uniref:gp436 family protein n=1 Tax=Limnobaculum xujianqingii TaxID=2738837 RepID=UPI001126D19D|nr:phage protein Gp36 family protein [Limnobaculum xujianqingii]